VHAAQQLVLAADGVLEAERARQPVARPPQRRLPLNEASTAPVHTKNKNSFMVSIKRRPTIVGQRWELKFHALHFLYIVFAVEVSDT
jgi:hypothetical protein